MNDTDVTEEQLREKLIELGWEKIDRIDSRLEMWCVGVHSPYNPYQEGHRGAESIFIPTNKNAPDYHQVLSRAVRTVAHITVDPVKVLWG